MRMDADLFIVKPIVKDPFAYMLENRCDWLTDMKSVDAKGCFEGQQDAAVEFAQAHQGCCDDGGEFKIKSFRYAVQR
jgi:hypothetical protein